MTLIFCELNKVSRFKRRSFENNTGEFFVEEGGDIFFT